MNTELTARGQFLIDEYTKPLDFGGELPDLGQEHAQDFLNVIHEQGYESVAGIITINSRSLAVNSLVRQIDLVSNNPIPLEAVAGPYIMRHHHSGEYQLYPGLMIYQRHDTYVQSVTS